jgi:hypothetical protein
MVAWFLIFYMSGWNAGGPAVAAPFTSKEACERAAEAIKATNRLQGRLEGWVCVPQS